VARHRLTEQEMDFKLAQTSLIWRNIARITGEVLRYGCIAFLAYQLFATVRSFAGKETNANILLDIITNMRIDKWIGYVFGVLGLIIGAIRNGQLKKTKRELSEYIRGMEKKIDPEKGEKYDND
jgi:hypothetical protein